jgi:hypothetical protein
MTVTLKTQNDSGARSFKTEDNVITIHKRLLYTRTLPFRNFATVLIHTITDNIVTGV